ncbi:MAG: spermidine synthase, partial [Planctomycetota bacterium]
RNTQKLQAHVPMLAHPDPRDVCQVGFGSGETAHIFSSYDVDRFDCVEISRAVIEMAARHFRDINGGVVESPRFNAIIMDALAYLKYTDRQYDVIANDATWPNLAGPAMLYTLEYFRSGRQRLKPGGIMTSWLPLAMAAEDFRSVLKTFHAVFPHVYVWSALSHRNKHALIIGKMEPLQIDAARFMQRFNRFARDDLELVHLADPALFLASHLASAEDMEAALADVPLNTQDSPLLQFMNSRPELYNERARRRYVPRSLGLLADHSESVLDRLTNLEALDRPQSFRREVLRMERACDHILRAIALAWDDPVRSEEELRAAARLAPHHPVFAAMAARLRDGP